VDSPFALRDSWYKRLDRDKWYLFGIGSYAGAPGKVVASFYCGHYCTDREYSTIDIFIDQEQASVEMVHGYCFVHGYLFPYIPFMFLVVDI